MIMDEVELIRRLGDVESLPAGVSERARSELRVAMAASGAPGSDPEKGRPPRRSRGRRRPASAVRRRRVLAGAIGIAAGAAVVGGGVAALGPGGAAGHDPAARVASPPAAAPSTAVPAPTPPPLAAPTVMYELASASLSQTPAQDRYVVYSETDTQTDYPGELKRTHVVDVRTGASTNYQQAYSSSGVKVPNSNYAPGGPPTTLPPHPTAEQQAYEQAWARAGAATGQSTDSGPPTEARTGPQLQDSRAWFDALPTDPAALRVKLLDLATKPHDGISPALMPSFTSDDYIYQEANTLLWNPVVSPELRSALYKVLAGTSGYTVTRGTDPAGRPAIVMTRHYTGITEVDVTYEDPGTGAVLAQVWKNPGEVITGVYQPVTYTNSIPSNPYTG